MDRLGRPSHIAYRIVRGKIDVAAARVSRKAARPRAGRRKLHAP